MTKEKLDEITKHLKKYTPQINNSATAYGITVKYAESGARYEDIIMLYLNMLSFLNDGVLLPDFEKRISQHNGYSSYEDSVKAPDSPFPD